MRGHSRFWIFVFVSVHLLFVSFAQDASTKLDCGDTIEGEFSQLSEWHGYVITLGPGDMLKVGSVPIGDYLNTRFSIEEPAGRVILETDFSKTPIAETGILSGRGEYKIFIYNTNTYDQYGAAGVYTIYVSCTLRNGTIIEAGVAQ